jgi:hypothetical protein
MWLESRNIAWMSKKEALEIKHKHITHKHEKGIKYPVLNKSRIAMQSNWYSIKNPVDFLHFNRFKEEFGDDTVIKLNESHT